MNKIFTQKHRFIIVMLCIFLFLVNKTYAFKSSPTSVTGQVFLRVQTKHLSVNLNFNYTDPRDSTNTIGLLITPDVKLQKVSGRDVESFDIDTSSRPFSTIKIKFRNSLPKDAATKFTVSYSGMIKKGFWDKTYNRIDLDPDFMNLPISSSLNNFTYNISVSSDDPGYKFCDFNRLTMAAEINVVSDKPSYYFNSIIATKAISLKRIKRSGYAINIISTKPDNVTNMIEEKGAGILDYYNKSFAGKDTINSSLVVYRPLPDSVLPVIRSHDRSIVFSDDHSRIKVLAHEIGHFWWNRGDAFNTEKWLSESFAEYSSLIYMRTQNKKDYEDHLAKAQSVVSKAPAMIGSNRFGNFGDDLLYFKGLFLLSELETELGQKQIANFLGILNDKEVDSTPALLYELQLTSSAEIRNQFEKQLNKQQISVI